MRTRRSAEDARERILAAAEQHLLRGGPDAVRVQPLARELGITDAAIHHHFGNRQGLLEALLRRSARSVKAALLALAQHASQSGHAIRMADIADALLDLYERRGGARLALWLRMAGWRERGSGMLRPLADALHAQRVERAKAQARTIPSLDDTLSLVTLISSALLADVLVGNPMLRSVGLPGDRAGEQAYRTWLIETLERLF